MNKSVSPFACCEGSLLSYCLHPDTASKSIMELTAIGVSNLHITPGLLAEIKTEDFPEVKFTAWVSYPWSTGTASSRRFELLECVRLGAVSAAVVLPPYSADYFSPASLEKEMSKLLSTAPELKVSFVLDIETIQGNPLSVLMRILRGLKPAAVIATGKEPGACVKEQNLAAFRKKLHRKINLVAGGNCLALEKAGRLIEAGADAFLSSKPGLFLDGGADK